MESGGGRQEIAPRFPSGWTNRRALRLQAKVAAPAPSSARRNPGSAPRTRVRFPPPVGVGEKKPSTGRFFWMLWWRRRESNPPLSQGFTWVAEASMAPVAYLSQNLWRSSEHLRQKTSIWRSTFAFIVARIQVVCGKAAQAEGEQ